MTADSGAASSGAAPESSDDVERLRRSLYTRDGASAEAVAGYERIAARALPEPPIDAQAVPEPHEDPDGAGPLAPPEPVLLALRGASLRIRALLGGGVVLVLVVIGAVLLSPRPLPDSVRPPALPGRLLLTYSRHSNPQSAPHAITFEPAYYTAYQPRGRRVRVALRCVGSGSVRISAGPRFFFRCGERETVSVRTSGPITTPFLILGRTTGNVVWGVRVVLLEPVRSAAG